MKPIALDAKSNKATLFDEDTAYIGYRKTSSAQAWENVLLRRLPISSFEDSLDILKIRQVVDELKKILGSSNRLSQTYQETNLI